MEKEIYLAGGCFWGLEKFLAAISGVTATEVGYANGKTENPTYEEVCHKNTGHAETVKVAYNSEKASLGFILDLFYQVINPTTKNRQGMDVGAQYRTGVYYVDDTDREIILESLRKLQTQYDRPVVVEALPLQNFYPAEEYHQDYLDKNPGGYCHIGLEDFDMARNAVYKP